MFFKLTIVLLATFYVKAENNHLCPCDNEESIKENDLLRKHLLEMIPDGDLTEAQKELASVYPGVLYQLGCGRCEEKQRRKRKIMPEPDTPVETEDLGKERKAYISTDCPSGYKKISFLCIPKEDVDYFGNDY